MRQRRNGCVLRGRRRKNKLNKTQWASRQFSRYDLTITKIQKLLGLITASGMVATAIALGATLILVCLLVLGFGVIMILAYILDKIGFQKATAEEIWGATTSRLWWNQINVLAILYNEYGNMSEEERQKKFAEFMCELRIDNL